MCSRVYDSQFRKIPFYESHQYMLPFVGINYESLKHKKLLLVGESHYVRENTKVHLDVDAWYNGSAVLEEEDCDYCNTRNARLFGYGNFIEPIENDLEKIFPSGINEIASYNYFLRPANKGKSFREICTKKDREFAVRNFHNILEILSPDLIVFAGVFAFDSAEWKDYPIYFGEYLWDYTKRKKIEYLPCNHPSRGEWTQPIRRGGMAGRNNSQVFLEFLQKNWMK